MPRRLLDPLIVPARRPPASPAPAVNAGFHAYARRTGRPGSRAADPVAVQERTLRRLVRRGRGTRFGRDHGFARDPDAWPTSRRAVPLRTYEDLWDDYLKDQYPVFDDLTWPGPDPLPRA